MEFKLLNDDDKTIGCICIGTDYIVIEENPLFSETINFLDPKEMIFKTYRYNRQGHKTHISYSQIFRDTKEIKRIEDKALSMGYN